jgi:hypothetical protein
VHSQDGIDWINAAMDCECFTGGYSEDETLPAVVELVVVATKPNAISFIPEHATHCRKVDSKVPLLFWSLSLI